MVYWGSIHERCAAAAVGTTGLSFDLEKTWALLAESLYGALSTDEARFCDHCGGTWEKSLITARATAVEPC